MKKLLLTLLAVVCFLPASAQSLPGTWVASEIVEENDDIMKMKADVTDELVLSADGTFSESGNMKSTIEMENVSFSFTIVYSSGGTWKREGNNLSIQYNPKLAKASVTEADMPGILKAMIANTAAKELKKEMSSKKPDVYQIVSLSETQMELADLDSKEQDIQVFKRK